MAEGRVAHEPRVGMFGLLGSRNLGNDASLQVVVDHVRRCSPASVIDAMCSGPERLEREWAIPAVPILWSHRFEGRDLGPWRSMGMRLAGLVVDPFRVAMWVRRHDLVIVPGMGVLEASLPLHPWGVPYSMLLLCASGRLFGTPVALVSVGASDISHRLTRTLFNLAARLATYRSYRDPASREAMRRRGLAVEGDPVYPDLVFGMDNPAGGQDSSPGGMVGVGVMAYFGGNDDRRKALEIHARYVSAMGGFVEWLVRSGRPVRLFWGDDVDAPVAQEIARAVNERHPDGGAAAVVAERFGSLKELMQEMAGVDLVVATRFHNVLSALKLAKPTVSVGYSRKFDELMESMGQAAFARSARSVDMDGLIRDFQELERRSPQIREVLRERRGEMATRVECQLAEVSALIPASGEERPLQRPRSGWRDRGSATGRHDQVTYYKRMFWAEENTKYAEPHFRLRKMATVVNRLAGAGRCTLLDVGCGPATLGRLLRPNVEYHGIDIAIQEPSPNLKEMDILESRVDFDGRKFDLVVAQGLFEYLGEHQDIKLSEIAELVDEGGRFVTTYVNFDHRRPSVYWPYSNVQDAAAFRRALERYFVIERQFPSSINWAHSEPNRRWLRLLNLPIRFRVPLVDRNLSVEYFYICTPRPTDRIPSAVG